jgi:N-acetylmuramoyl-L-alanine amidase
MKSLNRRETAGHRPAPFAALLAIVTGAILLQPGAALGRQLPTGSRLPGPQSSGERNAGVVIARNGVATDERLRGTYLDGGELYVRLSDLGTYLSARDHFYFKNKYELFVGKRTIKFTLGSSAVILDSEQSRSVNLPRPVRLHRGVLYAPAAGVADVLTAFTGRQCDYLPEREWLNYGGSGLNVLGIELIDNPQQGTQVTILTTEAISYEATSQGDGVVNVTLEGARADVNHLRRTRRLGLVNKIEVFELGDDVLQVSFHLSRRYNDRPAFHQTPEGLIFSFRRSSAGERIDPAAREPAAAPPKTIRTVVIDAGHGGKDPGSVGAGGLQEKEVALDIARRLKERFQKDPRTRDIRIIMTRDSDVFVSLPRRYQMANEGEGDLFISIHANALVDRSVNGFITFFLAEAKNDEARQIAALENSAVEYEATPRDRQIESGDFLKGILGELISTRYLEESQELAGIVQDEMTTKIGRQVRPRRLDQAGFLVLNGAYMPSILVEVAFISNQAEERFLRQNSFKNKVADAIHEAVIKYQERVEAGR